ncbi:MAG TPA: methyltransferase domain-containing protein [Solirubrobacteraceae bacterium]|jgi:SAM-dependent methyltransferase|nr:methyltransferase domain-containing protein [Solirubrobacteraceae bacterium]
MLTREVLAFVRSSLPQPPARVLEIGAGKGELALSLGVAGYDVTAIDPAAEPGSHVQRLSLLEVTGSFAAAVAVVSLHHVEPLAESIAHLATLLRPEATLVIDEIDIDRYDERATGWWLGQRRALGYPEADRDPAGMLAFLREHIHPLSSIEAALRPHFAIGPPTRGPYLHRWEVGTGLWEAEIDLIADGLLPAVGCRQVARRRG